MALLTLAALFWVVLHVVVAGPLRPGLAGRLGENGFRALFSVLSAIGLIGLILGYRATPYVPLWPAPPGGRALAALLVLIAFLLLVFGASADNPTSPAADRLSPGELPMRGITRITRHPMLWAFALWALAHLLVNGHLAGALLFGAILVTALNGMVSIDRKRRRKLGPAWDEFAARTSRVPFAAILSGRGELRIGELSPIRVLIGVLLFAAAAALHGRVLGVSPFGP